MSADRLIGRLLERVDELRFQNHCLKHGKPTLFVGCADGSVQTAMFNPLNGSISGCSVQARVKGMAMYMCTDSSGKFLFVAEAGSHTEGAFAWIQPRMVDRPKFVF